jgi:Lon protease-like protein
MMETEYGVNKMQLPEEVPVMILPNTTLFPQAMLPLFIFEPRYRKMLSAALETHRMFCVAMRRPDEESGQASPVAGIGLIRAAVTNKDGTSYVMLQGIARVALAERVRARPYPVYRVKPMHENKVDTVKVDALVHRLRELVTQRLEQGFQISLPQLPPSLTMEAGEDATAMMAKSIKKFFQQVTSLNAPEVLADQVTCALVADASARQMILETIDVEHRLRQLIRILLAEIRRNQKNSQK